MLEQSCQKFLDEPEMLEDEIIVNALFRLLANGNQLLDQLYNEHVEQYFSKLNEVLTRQLKHSNQICEVLRAQKHARVKVQRDLLQLQDFLHQKQGNPKELAQIIDCQQHFVKFVNCPNKIMDCSMLKADNKMNDVINNLLKSNQDLSNSVNSAQKIDYGVSLTHQHIEEQRTVNPYREKMVQRKEKCMKVAQGKVFYMSLMYQTTDKARTGRCIYCRCDPTFKPADIQLNSLTHFFGDSCGPIKLEPELIDKLEASIDREDKYAMFSREGIYFHEGCALWSTETIVDEILGEINFDSMVYAVIKSQATKCKLCDVIGPTVRCNFPNCEIAIHFDCFKTLTPQDQKLDFHQKYRIRCPVHVQKPYIRPSWQKPGTTIKKRNISAEILNESYVLSMFDKMEKKPRLD